MRAGAQGEPRPEPKGMAGSEPKGMARSEAQGMARSETKAMTSSEAKGMARSGENRRVRPRAAAIRWPMRVGAVLALPILAASGCADGNEPAGLGEVAELTPAVFDGATQTTDPSLAVDPRTGDLLALWVEERGGEWELRFARSRDGGTTFSASRRVNDVRGDVHPHAEGAPRLVAAPGVVAAFWNNRIEVEERAFNASDMRFSRSIDGGRTWEPSRTLQDDTVGTLPRGNSFHGATWLGDSLLVVAWLDGRDRDARRVERAVASGVDPEEARRDPEAYADPDDPHDGDASVYAAVSRDLGATWETSNARVRGGICPCCRVTLVRGPDGDGAGAWRHNFEGSIRDPETMTFAGAEGVPAGDAPAVRLHQDGWEYPGCPHSGPGLDFGPDGTLHAVWYTGAEGRTGVHYARRAPEDAAFSEPEPVVAGEAIPIANPTLAALPDGRALVAHNVTSDGRRALALTRIGAPGTVESRHEVAGSEGGTHPQIVLLPDGRAVVAWTQSRAGVQRVRVVRITPGGGAAGTREEAGAEPGRTAAPDYAARTLEGDEVSLADLRGEVVVLNVWATWCGPCVREMPALEELHRDLGPRGLRVIGASIDRASARDAIHEFLERNGISFTILHDPDQIVTQRFRTIGVPQTFLIDPEGRIAHRWIGEFDPSAPQARNRIEGLLESNAGG